MFTINEMPPRLDPELVKLLECAETGTIGHFFHSGFVDRGIAAVIGNARVAGTAVTVRTPHADSTIVHYLTKLVRPGDFVVIERCGDTRHACWGGAVSHAMKIAGIAGAAIDGPSTDLAEIRKIGLPVWCRGPSSITTKLLGLDGEINVPVTVGGQVIRPGDAILADESGVVVLDPSKAEAIAREAIADQEDEILLLERLRKGEFLPDISGATRLVEGNLTPRRA
ncbi:Dimethylmenaquinone methyltransferase [Rhizobium sp. CF080]|uniref:RraA family protein n=1 Tax=Rhizobium sp. (strain CF080) TaxID=1144310 RepID=UPI0002718911|nr:RraA family protein [Rhizobium sp. CF080]EUB99766.1 Dimethylmenaquinone methyltransferase [Rhizobium sp. CF080]